MKKIGILAFGGESSGGIFQYTMSMIDALSQKKDFNYVILTTEKNMIYDNKGLEIRKIPELKTNILKKTIKAASMYLGIRKPIVLSTIEKNAFFDIDIFISPIISPFPHFFLNKPYIFTLHDMQERYFPEFFSWIEKFKRYILKKNIASYASQIICESDYVKKDIVNFLGIDEKKINVLPAPPPFIINKEFSKTHLQEIKNKYHLPSRYIFYPAAQFWYHKNHIRLIEAFNIVNQKSKDIHLVLTGSKNEPQLQKSYMNILEKINELGLKEHVQILGFIDYEDMPAIFKMSEMLVMPSLFESVSIPVYEAFFLKVPVCCSNVVGLPEQIADAGVLFDPLDINDMADKIYTIISDVGIRAEIITKGFEKVANFNHKNYSTQLNEIIQRI